MPARPGWPGKEAVKQLLLLFLLRPREGAKYCDEYVCLSVCLSVHSHSSNTTRLDFTYFCMLFVAVARSFSGGVAICYVLPVLWMTSCFHVRALWCVMCIPRRWQNTISIYNSRDSNQILLKYKDKQILFVGGTPGARSAIYNCLVVVVIFINPVIYDCKL